MSHPSDHQNESHHVRRVVLPSGRAIEVVYFDGPADAAAGATAPAEQLHICPQCASDLVYPTEWHEASPTHWDVMLRCPNCEWHSSGQFDQASVDRFDGELDRGTEAVLRDLRRLTRANMEDEIERFTIALAADAIWPMDF